jgi:T-complex protein 1 subunit beta
MSSFVGAIAIADLVKTTLGPKGMDKILQRVSQQDQSISVTNDGATILKAVNIDNPAAKVLVDIAKVQDDEVGDGTTSVAVFCGELLREAEKLIAQRIHPQTICKGWRLARDAARKALEEHARDNAANEEKVRGEGWGLKLGPVLLGALWPNLMVWGHGVVFLKPSLQSTPHQTYPPNPPLL